MKKIISFAVFSLIAGVLFTTSALAQNIGSLQNIVTPGFSFKKDLRVGDTDPDVREMQRILNADIDTVVATDGDGSRGKEITYFGEKTKLAVIKFQNKYREAILTPAGLVSGNGLVIETYDPGTTTDLLGITMAYISDGGVSEDPLYEMVFKLDGSQAIQIYNDAGESAFDLFNFGMSLAYIVYANKLKWRGRTRDFVIRCIYLKSA
jgi:peptidoglycan hydrolase-like protein with peptidoglycan-binding domain